MATQGHGQPLSSAWRVCGLELHLLATWPCSLGASLRVRCRERAFRRWLRFDLGPVFMMRFCLPCDHLLSHAALLGGASSVVDVYNGNTGTWSTAKISVACYSLATASVGNVALFAGGVDSPSALFWRGGAECTWLRVILRPCASVRPFSTHFLMLFAFRI